MPDFNLVHPHGWEYDLHSVYAAYVGYFQIHSVPWYDRTWGHLFNSFGDFLSFSWPVITVTDDWTGKPHIVTRYNSIGAFLKMVKTRFGETLPIVENMLKVTPFENQQRHLRTITDWASYQKLHATLPAVVLGALKTRVRSGEPKAVRELWDKKDKTFLAIDFEWSERNTSSVLEWGYAAVRCGHLQALNHWPPIPDTNYRKGHYIVSEYVDKLVNKHCPTFPWTYAFGDSQVVSKTKLPQIIQAIISSLASPDSDTTPNSLVLLAHGISGDLQKLEEMKIKLPHNMLIVDTSSYERALFNSGLRGPMLDALTNGARLPGSTLSLENLLRSLNAEIPCAHHNSGNDAFLCLLALQLLLEGGTENVKLPSVKTRIVRPGTSSRQNSGGLGPSGVIPMAIQPMMGPAALYAGGSSPSLSPGSFAYTQVASASQIDAAEEFGQVRRSPRRGSPMKNASVAIRASRSVTGNGKRNTEDAPVLAMGVMTLR